MRKKNRFERYVLMVDRLYPVKIVSTKERAVKEKLKIKEKTGYNAAIKRLRKDEHIDPNTFYTFIGRAGDNYYGKSK